MQNTKEFSSLQEDMVRSADLYLKYLVDHRKDGKGMFSAQVIGIQNTLLDTDIALITDRKIRNADGITIRIGGTVYENNSEKIHYYIRSVDRRRLVISPMPELEEHISRAAEEKEKIFVEVDLTFLVRRVRDWYTKFASRVKLPSVMPECPYDAENPIALSRNQMECVNKALSSPLSYIWGAPGTGKTKHVLAACVYSYIKAGKKVLLLAPTNAALEQSLSGLLLALSKDGTFNPNGKVYRIGIASDSFAQSWPNICGRGAYLYLRTEMMEELGRLQYENRMIESTLNCRKGKSEEYKCDSYPSVESKELENRIKENTEKINELMIESRKFEDNKNIMAFFSRFSVIAATVDASIRWLPPDGKFKPDHVFLDEAGYCSVIKGLTLTAFDCPITMLGDHMQLPPVFDCDDYKLMNLPETRIVRLWQISTLYYEDVLFCGDRNRLCAGELLRRPRFDNTTVGALTETHRFGPSLANVLTGIYQNNLRSMSVNETQILFVNAPKPEPEKGADEEGNQRRTNHVEAKCIRAMVEHNLAGYEYSLGIITPYKNQRRLIDGSIRRLLKKYERTEDMEDDILTVHRSQGREWDVVLFSVTDTWNEKCLTDSNRLEAKKLINTAVSRAKKLLVLVGDADSWLQHGGQLISDLFRVAQKCDTEIRFSDYCTGAMRNEEVDRS
jgi:hypothetical protein